MTNCTPTISYNKNNCAQSLTIMTQEPYRYRYTRRHPLLSYMDSMMHTIELQNQNRITAHNLRVRRTYTAPKLVTTKLSHISQETYSTCAICFEETPAAPIRTSCKHHFCVPCLYEWFETNHSCPICRKNVKYTRLLTIVDTKSKMTITDTKGRKFECEPITSSKRSDYRTVDFVNPRIYHIPRPQSSSDYEISDDDDYDHIERIVLEIGD